MWSLIDKNGRAVSLKGNEVISVGRKNATIILDNDASISKQHAIIRVSGSSCTITDAGSKYGTFLVQEREKIPITKAGYKARHLDTIQFGLQDHSFTVFQAAAKYCVLASGATREEREFLPTVLAKIDGELYSEWSDKCTHVTCSRVKLTEKINCALVSGLPIVSIEYWKEVLKAQQTKNSPPDPADYIPPLDNQIIAGGKVSLLPNPERKIIFKGLTFVHFDEVQCKLYCQIIKLAGGISSMHTDARNFPQDSGDKILIVQPLSTSSQVESPPCPEYTLIHNKLQRAKLRTIPETEIPLAILHCSIKQYCNPRFNYTDLLKSSVKREATEISTSRVLVEETQEDSKPLKQVKHEMIPESAVIDTPTSQMYNQSLARLPEKEQENNVKSSTKRFEVLEPSVSSSSSNSKKRDSSCMDVDDSDVTDNSLKSAADGPVKRMKEVLQKKPTINSKKIVACQSETSSSKLINTKKPAAFVDDSSPESTVEKRAHTLVKKKPTEELAKNLKKEKSHDFANSSPESSPPEHRPSTPTAVINDEPPRTSREPSKESAGSSSTYGQEKADTEITTKKPVLIEKSSKSSTEATRQTHSLSLNSKDKTKKRMMVIIDSDEEDPAESSPPKKKQKSHANKRSDNNENIQWTTTGPHNEALQADPNMSTNSRNGYKIYKNKNIIIIPTKRLTKSDMYIWGSRSV